MQRRPELAAKAPSISHADVLHMGLSAAELEQGPVAARFVAAVVEFQKYLVSMNGKLDALEEEMSRMRANVTRSNDKTWKVKNEALKIIRYSNSFPFYHRKLQRP